MLVDSHFWKHEISGVVNAWKKLLIWTVFDKLCFLLLLNYLLQSDKRDHFYFRPFAVSSDTDRQYHHELCIQLNSDLKTLNILCICYTCTFVTVTEYVIGI